MKRSQGDGILNNSMTKPSIFVALTLTVLQGCAITNTTETISSCFTSKTKLSVVKVDEKNYRIFAVGNESKSLHRRLQSSQDCFADTKWSNDWRISVFANSQYAGYKDEPKIIPLHKNNNWAKAYIAEYIGPEDKYISMPAIK